MGQASKALEAFIKGIPDDQLQAPFPSGTVYKEKDFRLDNQGVSSFLLPCYLILMVIDHDKLTKKL